MNELDGFDPPPFAEDSDSIAAVVTRIRDWLGKNDWSWEDADDASYLRTGVQGRHARFGIILGARGAGPCFICFALYDFEVPVRARPACADLVNRINFAALLGCFELDPDDGELRFRVTFPLDGAELSDEQIERGLFVSAMMADRYFPAFMALIHAGLPPVEALEAVDRPN